MNCDRSTRTNRYGALISEEVYTAKESKDFLDKLYGNSIERLITTLYSNKVIKNSDLAELRQFLDQLEEGGEND